MNKVILMGRLTRDPEVRYSQSNTGDGQMAIARYTLAVDRRFNRNGDQSADFIGCVAFGRSAEFAAAVLPCEGSLYPDGESNRGKAGDSYHECGKCGAGHYKRLGDDVLRLL